MNSQEFLEELKKKLRFKDDDLMHYCQIFISIFRNSVLRQRLDRYTQNVNDFYKGFEKE